MDLSDLFTTKSQANDFIARLNSTIDMVYTTGFDLEKVLMQQFGLRKKDALMKLLRDSKLNGTTATDVQEFLKKLQETASSLPIVSLAIAFEPTEETLQALSRWFLSTLNMHVLFDIQLDTALIAGATITYNGKFKDYSIRPVWDNIVQRSLHPDMQKPTQQNVATH